MNNITIQIIIFIIAVLASLGIGVYVLVNQYHSFMHRSFALFVAGFSLWGSSIVGLYLTHNFSFSALVFMSGALWFVGLLCFTYSFPHGTIPPERFYIWVIPALCIFILAPFNVFISDFIVDPEGYLQPINNLYFLIPFVMTFISYITYSIILLCTNYQKYKKDAEYKMQFKYLFIGMGIFIFSIIIFDTVLPAFNIYRFNLIGPSTAIFFFSFTAYAIARHKFLDLRIIIQRGVIYTIMLGLCIGVYISILAIIESVFREATNTTAILSAGFTMVLGILFFYPLENYFRKVTDTIFFKNRYNYADALHALSKVLHTNVTETDIIAASSQLLKEIFKTKEVQFQLSVYPDTPLSPSLERPLVMPIIFEGKPIGLLELGPKRSGDKYNKTDIQLLETFVYQAAVALEKGRLYEKVEGYNIHLEHVVEERTREIKQLQEDQNQAMIDISHNLQTPLAIITGELDLLPDHWADNEKMEVVKKSLHRVSQFIRQLLHLAKLNHSAFSVELSRVDLSAIVREQVEYFEVMAEDKGIKIVSLISGKVIIMGNKRLLGELLTNLVVNSINYRRTDIESMITISLLRNETSVGLIVEDNGMGISEETLPEIFTRFYTSPQRGNTNGTGLGLAICKKIVEKHNGTIAASSTLGKKTVFVIIFPKAE